SLHLMLSRIRSTNTPDLVISGTTGYQDHYNPPNTLVAQGTFSMPTSVVIESEYSEMQDSTEPSKSTKECIHYYRKLKRATINSYDETSTGGDRYVVTGPNAHWYSWGSYGHIYHTGLDLVFPTSVSSLKAQAMHAFLNRNQVDNLLNAVESHQVVSSVTQLGELVRRMRKGGSASALQMMSGSGKFRNVIERLDRIKALDISNLYLMWQFGFAPLISDMRKITKAVKTLKVDIDRAIATQDKPYTTVARTYGEVVIKTTGPYAPPGYSPDPNPLDGTIWHSRNYYLKRPYRLVGVRGKNSSTYNSDVFKTLKYLIDRFVSAGPASLVWERIPYSFVIDWFVNLSGVIDYLDNLITGSKDINDVWTTEGYHAILSVIKHKHPSWTSDSDSQVTAQNELKYYHRQPLDNSFAIVPSGRFGKKQALLSAALLHQLVATLKGKSPL
ncbi:TPA_asm: maturation protein, partial [ssRNA phage ESO001]